MGETDLFFHLKLGDVIRAQHAIPFRNLFSFTFPDAPDPDLAWGFQVVVSWLYAHGGFSAIVLFKVACIVTTSALLFVASLRAGASPVATAIATCIAICTADQRLVERPHLLTFVGLGVLAIVIERRIAIIPAIALVWANFHAGVFLCVVVLVLHLVGTRRIAPRTIAIVALTCIASMCTPAGPRLLRYLAWHTGLGSTRIIEEFRVADVLDDPWFFAMLALVLASALRLRRTQLQRILPSLVVAVLAWRSVRFVAEWAFLSTPLLALGLTELRLSRIAAVLTSVAIALTMLLERHPLELGLADDVAPLPAIAFVTEHGLRERLYHDLDVGCYLLWEGWPRYRVFQDARLPAYPDDFHRALDDLDPQRFTALLDRFSVDAALINDPDVNVRAGSFDPEAWALVYRADDALVFARRTPAHASTIARYEIPLRVRTRLIGGTTFEPLRAPPRGAVTCDWQRRLVVALVDVARPDLALDARARALAAGCSATDDELERLERR